MEREEKRKGEWRGRRRERENGEGGEEKGRMEREEKRSDCKS